MKSKLSQVILGSGWIFLCLFIVSAYAFNSLSSNSATSKFSPIKLDSHVHMFNGAIQCNLIGEELTARKEVLKEEIFAKVTKREESKNGIIYYFENDPKLLQSVLEHVQIEKACCPFFKFDISILPFDNGFALQISGSEDAMEFIKEFESS